MSKKNAKQDFKIPRIVSAPLGDKKPRVAVFPNEQCLPEFRADQMDMDGPWGWSRFDVIHFQEILIKIFECQKITWQILYQKKSHLVDIAKLIPEAQKRLRIIGKDDLDQLYSLRISGKKRIWGIKEGNLLWLLWWDPEHAVCESIGANN